MKHSLAALAVWFAASTVALAPLPRALAAAPPAPVPAEVIVKFKPQADLLRAHALSQRASAVDVRRVLEGRAASLGARIGRTLDAGAAVGPRAQVVRGAGFDAVALAARLAADPDVEYAVPNGRKRIAAAPNDPLYAAAAAGVRPRGPDAGQWYLRAPVAGVVVSSIDIEAAWTLTFGAPGTVVAVLDTGVRADHPDLGGGRLLPGYDFVSRTTVANDGDGRDGDPSDPGDWVSQADLTADALLPVGQRVFNGCDVADSSWHGTSTASLIGARANDGVGMAGVAPGVSVLPLRVLGKCYGTDADIQAAMLWAAGIEVAGVATNPNPAQVLNLSLGSSCGVNQNCACNAAYRDTIAQVLARNVSVIVAAGNDSGGPLGSPANCPGVVSVVALRQAGTKVGFSSLGSEVAISAPGGNCVVLSGACQYPILAATNDGQQMPTTASWTDSFRYTLGTSFASPLVAGTVGLMLSQQPSLTPDQVRSILSRTARPFPTTGAEATAGTPVQQCRAPVAGVVQDQCYCNTGFCGAGMMDAGAAVTAASGVLARITLVTPTPTVGLPVTLSATASSVGRGGVITGYAWSLTAGNGVATGFSSADNAATVTLTPIAAGSFTVTLAVTDGQMNTGLASQTVTVIAAPTPTPTPTPAPSGGGGGGGVASVGWLTGLAAAAVALGARRRRTPDV